jgi:K+-transporting ATPase ATPase C chain
MRRQLLPAVKVTVVLLVVLCGVYPIAVWAVGRTAFPRRADGSFISAGGRTVGSSLIGQSFTDKNGAPLPQYFQPRPSAAGTNGYDSTASSGSNLGPSDARLIGLVPGVNLDAKTNRYATKDDAWCIPVDKKGAAVLEPDPSTTLETNADGSFTCYPNTVAERAIAYRALNGMPADAKVPADAVTASGSGLDPDISISNAYLQAPRVARARHMSSARVLGLVREHTSQPILGIFGEQAVNVLELNLALDSLGR